MSEQELTEVFVYPPNKKLREAYIGLLGMVRTEGKVRFTVYECAKAICERNGWFMDHEIGSTKAPGQNYKNAIKLLKTLKHFHRFRGAAMIEIAAYDRLTRKRINNFETLFNLCLTDVYLSEYADSNDDLEWRDWEDSTKFLTPEEQIGVEQDVFYELTSLEHSESLSQGTDPIESKIEGFHQSKQEYVKTLISTGQVEGKIQG